MRRMNMNWTRNVFDFSRTLVDCMQFQNIQFEWIQTHATWSASDAFSTAPFDSPRAPNNAIRWSGMPAIDTSPQYHYSSAHHVLRGRNNRIQSRSAAMRVSGGNDIVPIDYVKWQSVFTCSCGCACSCKLLSNSNTFHSRNEHEIRCIEKTAVRNSFGSFILHILQMTYTRMISQI